MPPADDVIVVPAPEVHQVATVAQAPDARIVIGGDAIRALCDAARAAGRMALTVEPDPGRPERAGLVALAIAIAGQAPAYVPLAHRYIGAPVPPTAAELAPLHAVLRDPGVAKVVHDAKTVVRAFATPA